MMRTARFAVMWMLAISCLYLQAEIKEQKLTVTGKLTRAMAIGGESTGWTIDLDSETTIAGKAVHSIEIAYPKTEKLEKLANQHVRAKGKIGHRQGVETGDRIVLEVSSIKAAKNQ
jgi:hypothetical protein